MDARNLLCEVRNALAESSPEKKIEKVTRLAAMDVAPLADLEAFPLLACEAGRPDRPELVHPSQVPLRGLGKPEGRCALIHAIAHIEFNAINLGLDALSRFPGMPADFYRDWLSVAADEARHFAMLSKRLRDYGAAYGDFPAHNGLWEMAVKTAHDPLVRMALVPRVLEARGLDVTPGMIHRLKSVGDRQTVEILEIILDEEVPHVGIGSRWFSYCCRQRGVDPSATFQQLFGEYMQGGVKKPLNEPARLQAGFDATELAYLNACADAQEEKFKQP